MLTVKDILLFSVMRTKDVFASPKSLKGSFGLGSPLGDFGLYYFRNPDHKLRFCVLCLKIPFFKIQTPKAMPPFKYPLSFSLNLLLILHD